MKKIWKGILCIVVLFLMMFATNCIMYQIDRNLENYNDRYVFAVKGFVTSAQYYKNEDGTPATSITVKVDDYTATIIQNEDIKYSPYQEITVYTDYKQFGLSQYDIVPPRSSQLDLYFVTLIPIIIVLIVWWKCFGWKGLIQSIFFISILLCL